MLGHCERPWGCENCRGNWVWGGLGRVGIGVGFPGAVGRGVFGAGSGFRVGWCGWALGYHSMRFGHFPNVS